MPDDFYQRVIRVIKRIPKGRIATYGQVAALAGSPRAARQVVRALHSSSGKHKLPWHRVINSMGSVSLPRGQGFEQQTKMLEDEGVVFGLGGRVNLKRYQWRPRTIQR